MKEKISTEMWYDDLYATTRKMSTSQFIRCGANRKESVNKYIAKRFSAMYVFTIRRKVWFDKIRLEKSRLTHFIKNNKLRERMKTTKESEDF